MELSRARICVEIHGRPELRLDRPRGAERVPVVHNTGLLVQQGDSDVTGKWLRIKVANVEEVPEFTARNALHNLTANPKVDRASRFRGGRGVAVGGTGVAVGVRA